MEHLNHVKGFELVNSFLLPLNLRAHVTIYTMHPIIQFEVVLKFCKAEREQKLKGTCQPIMK